MYQNNDQAADAEEHDAQVPHEAAALHDRAACIFGNEMPAGVYRKACKTKQKFAHRFGDDSAVTYHLAAAELPVIGDRLGVRNLVMAPADAQPLDLAADAAAAGSPQPTPRSKADATGKPVVVGNIRMGFGHYRISMAMASAAHAMGFTPYWLDLCSFPQTTCSKVIRYQNDLYSKGSRWSQKYPLFNRLYWEPLNSEGFRKISYNASDQKTTELMVPVLRDLPRDVPFIGTHVWPSQAAVHAGLTHVVNAIPDNWPMALHLAEGSMHTVQTPSSYLGYRQLRGMDGNRALKPMPATSIAYTGHYIDHELVSNIAVDCAMRRARLAAGEPVRYLLTVGGAGAQQTLFTHIIDHLLPFVDSGQTALFVNVGDHRDVWDALATSSPALQDAVCHFNDFDEVAAFADNALNKPLDGIHAFCDSDIFAAVYSTNLLMRASDVLVTKPSELAFYPVPKLMIHRVGGHEAWGAIRAAEVGDGTYELQEPQEIASMIDSFQADRDLIAQMCNRIEAADALGVYDGAYEVVRLATERNR